MLSFPPHEMSVLVWVALVPLLFVLEGSRPWRAFSFSYLAGLVFIIGTFYWIWWVPGYNFLDEALLAFYLALYVGVWGLGIAWIRRRTAVPLALAAPAWWVALEYLRSNLGFLGLPWMLLGHTQYSFISLIQIAAFTGAYGLTFLIVLVNAAGAEALLYAHRRFRWQHGAAAVPPPLGTTATVALLLVATGVYGVNVIRAQDSGGERVTAALLQTSVPRDQKWDVAHRRRILEQNERLTRQAAATSPHLIVWPETAVPGDVEHHKVLKERVGQAAREANAFLLVGSAEHAKFTDRQLLDRRYNSVYLISPAGDIVGHYRKIILVPFGEYEPLHGIIRWPKVIAAVMGNHLPGERYSVFTAGAVPFSAVICWEISFPDLVRRFVQNGARFIINASNEAWFAGSSMPDEMLAMSVFRAVENRIAVARSSNLGVSAIIDPFGRVSRRFSGSGANGVPVDGVLAGEIPLTASGTFYTRHGDVFAFTCIATSLLLLSCAAVPLAAWRLVARRLPAVLTS